MFVASLADTALNLVHFLPSFSTAIFSASNFSASASGSLLFVDVSSNCLDTPPGTYLLPR